MDDTLLLYRNAKVEDTTAYDYSAKIFLKDTIPSASSLIARGLQNGDKFIFHTGRVTTIYMLGTMDSSVAFGYTSVVLSGKVVYCEEDMCFYKFSDSIPYMHYIYQPAVPFNFNNTSEQIYLKDFTYTAERMGKTPTLTADFYDKECYDNIWDNDTTNPKYRFYDIFTVFRGERYYFKLTPQSQLQNTDARYKHTINFVSEREKLEHAKMFDVVTTTTPDAPVSDSSKFVFYGTLSEFADRINASLIKEGITYSATYNDNTIYSGYHVVIDDDVTEEQRTTAATVSIENNSILQALDHLDTDYGVSYYVVGYEIHIGDKQADLTGAGHPIIEYGADDSLIQITRQNVTKDIITRITGYGSEDNIPYYYPNPSESGFLQGKYEKFGESVRNISSSNPSTSGATLNELYIKLGANNIGGTLYKFDGTAWVALCDVPRGRVYYNVANGTLNVCNVSSGAWESPSVPTLRHPYEWVKVGNNVMPATKLIFISTSTTQNASLPSYADEGDMCYIGKRRVTSTSSTYRKIYTYTNGAWDSGETPSSNTCYICNNTLYMYKSVNGNTTMYSMNGEYDKFIQLAKSDTLTFDKTLLRYTVGHVDKRTGTFNGVTKTNGIYTHNGKYCFDLVFEETVSDSEQLYAVLDTIYPLYGTQGDANKKAELAYIAINGITLSAAETELFAHRELSFSGVSKIALFIRQYTPFNPTRLFFGWHFDAENDVTVCTHSFGLAIKRNYPACILRKDDITQGFNRTHKGMVKKAVVLRGKQCVPSSTWYLDPQVGDNYRIHTALSDEFYEDFFVQNDDKAPCMNVQNDDICEEMTNYPYNSTGNFYKYNNGSWSAISNPISDTLTKKIIDIYNEVTEVRLFYYNKKWYLNNEATVLSAHGISLVGTAVRGDKITLEQIKYMQPQKNLMPSIYYKSDAQKRFFDAVLYPHARIRGVMLDRGGGEYYIDETIISTDNGKVANENYRASTNTFYDFENVIDRGHPRTHVEPISDIKPSITGLTVVVGGQTLRVDLFEEFCYDEQDNDDNWSAYERENGDDSNLDLKHPHFFAKLRPLGFNLFAMAIDEDEMVVNFNTGCCSACTFKVKVDNSAGIRNPIRLFGVDVYRQDSNGVMSLWHVAGTPQRYSDIPLYKLVNGNFVEAAEEWKRPVSTPTDGNTPRIDGDVVTVNYSIDDVQAAQHDTTENYVWIALEKDINTFSYPMPSVANNMKPVAISGNHTEDEADKFVFTHIKMPIRFVRAAEERLSKALVEYMSKNNAELFHYSIKFSRIFLSESTNTYADDLNENVKLHIQYADHSQKSFYVKSYTYKKVGGEPLPEISVELRENINVVRYRYSNRIDITRWDEQFEEIRRAEPFLRTIAGNGNGNGTSLVSSNLVSTLMRHLVSRNGSTLRGTLKTTTLSKIVGNLNIVRSSGQQVPVKEIDTNLGIDENSGVRGKAKNLLIDLGILDFDETRSYEIDEMVVYNSRLMRFTQKKTAGIWDDTKAVNDSVSNCIFRALGVQEYNAERTTKYNVGEKFFRNNKIYNVTTEFTPKVGSAHVTETVFANSTRKMDIIANFTEKDDTTTLRRTVDDVSRIINNLNEQILNGDSGIAIVMENVNKKLADLTSAMATENAYTRQYVAALADALKENEFLAQDSNVATAAGNVSDYMTQTSAVTTAATAANTELTGADVESAYNKLINFIAEVQFGQLVKDVHSAGGATDSTYAITHKIYETSQYMVGVPVEFNKKEAYDANQMVIHLKHLYQLTAGKAADVDWGDIDPSTKVNMDDILKKIVVFSTDAYDITSGSDFLEYGMYTMAAAFCEWVQKFISDYGDKGLLYSDLDDLVIKETADYKDGDGYNMFAEHTAYTSSQTKVYYTVLQYAVLRMERNGIIYAASTYTKELIKDDNKHIIFNVKTIQNMGVEVTKMMEECPTKSVIVGGEEKLCYYISIKDMAGKFGYNYLYAADYLVENETMYYDSGEKEYYLLVE